MDSSQTFMSHQMHGHQFSQYSGDPGDPEVGFQPTWPPSAEAVARMPQVDYTKLAEASYMVMSRKQISEYCRERGIKTTWRTPKEEYVKLAQPVLPGVNCWALSNLEMRARCKAHNVATPHDTRNYTKAQLAQKLKEDDAKWGL